MRELEKREKIILGAGGAVLGLLLIYFLVIFPYFSGVVKAEREIDQGKKDIQSMIGLYKNYLNLQANFKAAEARLKNKEDFSLLAALEQLGSESGMSGNIESMQERPRKDNPYYQESAVEVSLKKVDIRSLVTYLHKIEDYPHLLRIKRLSVETQFDDHNILNVKVEVSSFKPL